MSRISLEGSYEPVEVELWGNVYLVKDTVRSVREQVRELEQKSDATDDEDEQIGYLVEMFDLKLEPLAVDGGKKPPKASTVVLKKWKADELSIAKILRFFYAIGEAEETGRPT